MLKKISVVVLLFLASVGNSFISFSEPDWYQVYNKSGEIILSDVYAHKGASGYRDHEFGLVNFKGGYSGDSYYLLSGEHWSSENIKTSFDFGRWNGSYVLNIGRGNLFDFDNMLYLIQPYVTLVTDEPVHFGFNFIGSYRFFKNLTGSLSWHFNKVYFDDSSYGFNKYSQSLSSKDEFDIDLDFWLTDKLSVGYYLRDENMGLGVAYTNNYLKIIYYSPVNSERKESRWFFDIGFVLNVF
jgi:hypothetical protein